MSKLSSKVMHRLRRKARVRKVISGTSERPRLSVYISNKNVSVQVIDDTTNKTLLAATSLGQKTLLESNVTAKATWVGQEIAKRCQAKKIAKVVLDRNGKLYHGRIKALAEAARQVGLEI